MLKVEKRAPNWVDLELMGALDSQTMDIGLDALLQASQDVVDGVMMYRLPHLELPTGGAIAVELRRLPQLFGLLSKYRRCAVLSDASWIRTAAEVEGALLPGLDIKSFELHEVDAAEAWLAADGAPVAAIRS